ncbi:phosphatidylethanolamine-binding protein [Xylogone sp. PMI_703]|nr:phosphatidylethanolamine-binding protein [Xylogone sp. PMI_703]
MWFILRCLEWTLAKLLYRRRGYDHDLFYKGLAFEKFPKPTFDVISPDCGPTGAKLGVEYSQWGSGKVPRLTWPAGGPEVKEYIIVIEDPDAPMGHSNVHGIYCCVPGDKTSFGPEDLELLSEDKNGLKRISSGYLVGKNRRNIVYIAPRPPLGHGPHRYFFEVISLSQSLDSQKLSAVPTKQELSDAVIGMVCGWGLWIATFEQKWSM